MDVENYSDEEIKGMELLEGNYQLWIEWPPSPQYWNDESKPIIKLALIR